MKEICTALVKAQSQIRGAVKDSTNPHFKSRYADLESVIDAIREPLSANGLCFVQSVDTDYAKVNTIIFHISGEQIVSSVPFVGNMPDMQKVGAALTYARRQGLCTAFGVPQVDDDGNEAAAPVKAPVKNKYEVYDPIEERSKKPIKTPITDAVQKTFEDAGLKTEVISAPTFDRNNIESVNAVKAALAKAKIPNELIKKEKANFEKFLTEAKFIDFDDAVWQYFQDKGMKQ